MHEQNTQQQQHKQILGGHMQEWVTSKNKERVSGKACFKVQHSRTPLLHFSRDCTKIAITPGKTRSRKTWKSIPKIQICLGAELRGLAAAVRRTPEVNWNIAKPCTPWMCKFHVITSPPLAAESSQYTYLFSCYSLVAQAFASTSTTHKISCRASWKCASPLNSNLAAAQQMQCRIRETPNYVNASL